jgi:hypothetical protein
METGTRWLSPEQQVAWRAFLLGTAPLMAHLDDDQRPIGRGIKD